MYISNPPKGTRDFSHKYLTIRDYLINILKKNFELFSYSRIETPSFEMLSTLDNKYGEESDKLIFKILNSGNYLNNTNCFITNNNNYKIITKYLCKKGLRYDLTVPLMRYILNKKNKIFFPFKRYQIQPVWRADKPQKGRFREFIQCDVDIISHYKSLWDEIELIHLCNKIFNELQLSIIIKINHIDIIYALANICGIKTNIKYFLILLDKIEKIGIQKFKQEIIKTFNIPIINIDKLLYIIQYNGSFEDKINLLINNISNIKLAKKAIDDIMFIYNNLNKLYIKNHNLIFNLSLARGLNYYTGIIFEVISNNNQFNYALCGGGRYDNLTQKFGLNNLFGVGLSFGLDRIYLIMKELNNFKYLNIKKLIKIMFINFGDQEIIHAYKYINILRDNSIIVEIYPIIHKIKKQIKYANKKKFLYLAIVGKNEIKNNIIKIKNLNTGIELEYKNINFFIKKLKNYHL